jgi:predicted phosphodiesterase
MKPKYIRVASDLHLEQWTGQTAEFLVKTFVAPDERDAESVLVLAGDISSKFDQLIAFLREIEKRFLKVIYIPGNHEFYGHNMTEWSTKFSLELGVSEKTEFATCDVGYLELENARFIFSTLWADGGQSIAERGMVGSSLRDFYVIKIDQSHLNDPPRRFTVPDMAEIHRKQKAKIVEHLEKPFEGRTVVISHHMPSYRLCHPRFGNEINGGFASNCDALLAGGKIDLWIHGHTHDSIDTEMWGTRVVCNPSGYNNEHASEFNQYGPKFVEV